MDLKLWPLVHIEGKCTVHDDVLAGLWAEMQMNGKIEATFWDGSIKTVQEFVAYMKSNLNFVTLVVDLDKQKIVALFWLNNFQHGTAHAHFCFTDHYVPGAAEMVTTYWKSFKIDRVFIGITPESYTPVVKLMGKLGFQMVGTIPDYCDMVYRERREGAVIAYLLGG